MKSKANAQTKDKTARKNRQGSSINLTAVIPIENLGGSSSYAQQVQDIRTPQVPHDPSQVPISNTQPKLNSNISAVLVQADYMSGDRYTIATALNLEPKLGIIIIGDTNASDKANELKAFYQNSAQEAHERVTVLEVQGETAVKEAYKELTTQKPKRVLQAALKQVYDGMVTNLKRASFGTTTVADVYKKDSSDGKEGSINKVREQWESKSEPETHVIQQYLKLKDFSFKKKYLFLWAKKGERGAEKAHHFTSILTWRKLAELAREKGYMPVAVGDDIGLSTHPSLVEFWKDWDREPLYESLKSQGRKAQLGMWEFIAKNWGKDVASIGMRSGAIEVPALMGIRTIYLEEEGNQQAARMEKWIGTVPGYERHILTKAPGLKQQLYWKETIKKYDMSYRMDNTARADYINQLDNMVLGTPKRNIGENYISKSDEQTVEDRETLLEQIKKAGIMPETYGLSNKELSGIIQKLD